MQLWIEDEKLVLRNPPRIDRIGDRNQTRLSPYAERRQRAGASLAIRGVQRLKLFTDDWNRRIEVTKHRDNRRRDLGIEQRQIA